MKKDNFVSFQSSASSGGNIGLSTKANNDKPLLIENWLLHQVLDFLGNPDIAVTLWTGETIVPSHTSMANRLYIHDRNALYKLARNPSMNFGDLYSEGRITIEGDLVQFLINFNDALDRVENSAGYFKKSIHHILAKPPRDNSFSSSRVNIHHHYDIGNDFYKLWLDKEHMQYTCAYYPVSGMTLAQAQTAKLEHICRKLYLKPGDSVIEAGCGWGGLARYMAKHYGVNIKSYNISHEQITYARKTAKEQGLEKQIEYIEDDYRNIYGKFDVFVSIGMLEHVGRDNYEKLGEVIYRCLKENGRGLIHSIGRNRPAYMNAWIEKHIFPGAYPPSLKEMMDIFEPFNFSVLDIENLRLHYAKTLQDWLDRYNSHVNTVENMFDKDFARTWRLYLAGSTAAFVTGSLQLFQVLFTHQNNNNLFMSREHIYKGGLHD
ncbi:MAG: cyclopropane-fatty-acyl-phospholipid synthase family protein [Gammaproteobacteria bacterium]|nr:cyclopropane-fatty-acyl-phospholipid synthase family protein [Gammaproteobacteria bacterium]